MGRLKCSNSGKAPYGSALTTCLPAKRRDMRSDLGLRLGINALCLILRGASCLKQSVTEAVPSMKLDTSMANIKER